jgi:hypothetical protein
MISDELQERFRESWLAAIPQQYRLSAKEKGHIGDRILSSAIILPPPPCAMLTKFFAQFVPHLTAKQLQARAVREASGAKARAERTRKSRVRKKPSDPSVFTPAVTVVAVNEGRSKRLTKAVLVKLKLLT